jgi:hypothetical protein
MSDDFETELIRQRETALNAELAQAQANYQSAKHMDDYVGANSAIDHIQRIEAERSAGRRLYNDHIARKNYRAPELTDSEFLAMSPERMAQHPECIDRIFAKSKYYEKGQWADPEIAKRTQAGIQEVQRRRARGE